MKLSQPFYFRGACDASAGVALDAQTFAIANDEDNTMRYYQIDAPDDLPVKEDWSAALEVAGEPGKNETDIESAAKLGELIFWIGSHSRNREGKPRPDRHRLMAARLLATPGGPRLERAGALYKNLLADLRGIEPLRPLIDHADEQMIPPKNAGGVNIESICAVPMSTLLIGFRNPVPDGLALLVPLLNGPGVIAGEDPKFGELIRLDLGGFGIRDMAWWDNGFLLIGGPIGDPADGAKASQLYTWLGGTDAPQPLSLSLEGFNPEALVPCAIGGEPRLLILSDDGASDQGGTPCKALPEEHPQKRFRALWLS